MIDTVQTPILTLVFKAIATTAWVFFLLIGASTVQQIREMFEVLKPPHKKMVWTFYFIYVAIALIFFIISMLLVWL